MPSLLLGAAWGLPSESYQLKSLQWGSHWDSHTLYLSLMLWKAQRLLGMRVSATPLTPKLMHMLHNAGQSIFITVVAAEAAASVTS